MTNHLVQDVILALRRGYFYRKDQKKLQEAFQLRCWQLFYKHLQESPLRQELDNALHPKHDTPQTSLKRSTSTKSSQSSEATPLNAPGIMVGGGE